ncbi:hypothetical protein ACFLYA_01175 [Candidatus Dependentiae bacterium]
MKNQIILLSLFIAIPSQICAKAVPIKNETGQYVSITAIADKRKEMDYFYTGLRADTEDIIPLETPKKGIGLIRWNTDAQKIKKTYYEIEILPHEKIKSITLKPYGKYDVTVKGGFLGLGSKTFENQAADISKGKGKQGIHIYNATNKPIKISVQGSIWKKIKPEEETFVKTVTRKSKEIPLVRWITPDLESLKKTYLVAPDENIENIKTIVLKPDGTYDLTIKLKKDVTETRKEKSVPVLLKETKEDTDEFGYLDV